MATGEPRLEADRGASQSPATEPQQDQRKTEVVRTALWAVGVTILSNVANILKQVRDVVESAGQLEAFLRDHNWVSAVLLGGAIVWGNILLLRFLYRRLQRRLGATYRVLTALGCVVAVAGVFATNLFSLKSLLQDPVQVRRQLVSELAATQATEGGFRVTTAPESPQDYWVTAQAVKAILLAGTDDADGIKRAFAFIESERQVKVLRTPPNRAQKLSSALKLRRGLPLPTWSLSRSRAFGLIPSEPIR